MVVSLGINNELLDETGIKIISYELLNKALWKSEKEYIDKPSAAILIDQISYLIDKKNDSITSLSKPKNEKRRDMFFSIIEKTIDQFAEHANPNVRAGTAKFLSNWQKYINHSFTTKCMVLLDKLKKDARARVRYFAEGKT
jgi:hypothetical protein